MTAHPLPSAATPTSEAREASKRARLERRRESVLDAAEEFARDAERIEEMSSTLIARRAEVSVGWLYDHIGDRQAVVDSVLLRGLRDMQRTIMTLGLDFSKQNWTTQTDLLVDSTANFLRARRGFARLYYSRLASPNTAELNFQIDKETARLLTTTLTHATAEDASAIASMMTGIVDKGLELSFRIDEFASDTILEQTKAAVRGYLAPHLPTPA